MSAAISHICILHHHAARVCVGGGGGGNRNTRMRTHTINPPLVCVYAPHASRMYRGMPNLCLCASVRVRARRLTSAFCKTFHGALSSSSAVAAFSSQALAAQYISRMHLLNMCVAILRRSIYIKYTRERYCAHRFVSCVCVAAAVAAASALLPTLIQP